MYRVVLIVLFVCLLLRNGPMKASSCGVGESSDLVAEAAAALKRHSWEEAISLASKVIKEEAMADAYWIRGQAYEAARHFDKAIADYTKTLKLDPEAFVVYHSRGRAHFKSGHVDDSIADFDKHNKHSPSYEPYDWQRGISYYYAGQYAKGVRQFEIHKTVNPQDVENAVWHYLCKTRIDGVEKARAALIEITDDPRKWALPVYQMFQGKTAPREVLDKSSAGDASDESLFYSHLYVGLFHEAAGRADLAHKHIALAAEEYLSDHYMGDVARVHLDILLKKAHEKGKQPGQGR